MTVDRYGIATLEEGVGGLISLVEAGIVQEPRGDWKEGPVLLGDGNARYLGYPVATWRWNYIRAASRDALRQYCPGASQELYIQTINNEEEFAAYRAILHWPEEATSTMYDRAIKFSFEPFFFILEATSPEALALSSSDPTDGATGVAVSKTCTLTFNNGLTRTAIYNVAIFKATDGSLIASAITLDTSKTIVTINPNNSLEAATDYLLTYAVIDIYGQTLAGAVNFQTA